jgi:hypothetical protein
MTIVATLLGAVKRGDLSRAVCVTRRLIDSVCRDGEINESAIVPTRRM